MSIYRDFAYRIPGIDAIRETIEQDVTWGRWEVNRTWVVPVQIDPATRDTGHTGETTLLRPGLIMAQINATKIVTDWVALGAGGQEDIFGILLTPIQTQFFNADETRLGGFVLVGGQIKGSTLIENLTGTVGVVPPEIRTVTRFVLDDFGIQ